MVFSFSGDPSSEGERDEDDTGTSTEEETEEEQPSYPTSSLFIFSTLNMDTDYYPLAHLSNIRSRVWGHRLGTGHSSYTE